MKKKSYCDYMKSQLKSPSFLKIKLFVVGKGIDIEIELETFFYLPLKNV